MRGYYRTLSGKRLRRCYDIASGRVQQYLDAEIRFVMSRLTADDVVLELGCGYGRVGLRLAQGAKRLVGIDTSRDSLALARRLAGPDSPCEFMMMDAARLAFGEAVFDAVVCVQNGICSFGLDPDLLLRQALRVTRPGGRLLFSTYSERFWAHRLEWFAAQATAGLVGPIDYERTAAGIVVCQDGFRSAMISPAALAALGSSLHATPVITEVDESSVFCEIVVPGQ
jgi:SAM-dependent methyltransferase